MGGRGSRRSLQLSDRTPEGNSVSQRSARGQIVSSMGSQPVSVAVGYVWVLFTGRGPHATSVHGRGPRLRDLLRQR